MHRPRFRQALPLLLMVVEFALLSPAPSLHGANLPVLEPVAVPPFTSSGVSMTWDARGRLWLLESEPPATPGATDSPTRLLVLTPRGALHMDVQVFAPTLPASTGFELDRDGVYLGVGGEIWLLSDRNGDGRAEAPSVLISTQPGGRGSSAFRCFRWGGDGFLYAGWETSPPGAVPRLAPGWSRPDRLVSGVVRIRWRSSLLEQVSEGPEAVSSLEWDASGSLLALSSIQGGLSGITLGGRHASALPGVGRSPDPMVGLPAIATLSSRGFRADAFQLWPGQPGQDPVSLPFLITSTEQRGFRVGSLTVVAGAVRVPSAPSEPAGWPALPGPVQCSVQGPDGGLWIRSADKLFRWTPPASWLPARIADAGASCDLPVREPEMRGPWLGSDSPWTRRRAMTGWLPSTTPEERSWLSSRLGTHTAPAERAGALEVLLRDPTRPGAWAAGLTADRDPGIRLAMLRGARDREGDFGPWRGLLSSVLRDSDPRVRREALASLYWLGPGNSLRAAASRSTLSRDDVLLLLRQAMDLRPDLRAGVESAFFWRALEPVVVADPAAALEMLRRTDATHLPLSGELLGGSVRRLFEEGDPRHVDIALSVLASVAEESPELGAAGLAGMMLGQKSTKLWTGSKAVKRLIRTLGRSTNPAVVAAAQQVDAFCGNPAAQKAVLRRINDPSSTDPDRLRAIDFARLVPSDESRHELLELVQSPSGDAWSEAALDALHDTARAADVRLLLSRMGQLPAGVRSAVPGWVARRDDWLPLLIEAIDAGTLRVSDIPADVRARLAGHPDPRVRSRAAGVLSNPP